MKTLVNAVDILKLSSKSSDYLSSSIVLTMVLTMAAQFWSLLLSVLMLTPKESLAIYVQMPRPGGTIT
jgi:hypothetical protein